jgi:hypothetical protein
VVLDAVVSPAWEHSGHIGPFLAEGGMSQI